MNMQKPSMISKVILYILFLLFIPAATYADNNNAKSSVKTIRLGYFNFQNYMLGAEENAAKSGYAYDLLCDIAIINNWKYEFVYGDFNQLYAELLKGNIDILPCLVYTEERAKAHLFSNEEIYAEQYFISVLNKKSSKNLTIKDLDGKRLSTVSDTYQNVIFEKWAKANGITMQLVCTDSFDDSWTQLDEDKADYILNIDSAAQDSGYTSLFEVGSGSSRFAVAPGREDILEQLNSAIDTIYKINPFAIAHLKEKYLTGTLSSYKLTEQELQWLKNRDSIRIAGFKDNVPYTYLDSNGAAAGVYPDAVMNMFEKLDISVNVEWKLYKSETEMYQALQEGKVELICPYYHEHYYAQTNNMIISENFQNVNMGLLYSDKTHETEIKKIAVPYSLLDIYYVTDNYPNSKIFKFNTVDDCIKAVSKGQVDAAIAHVTALQEKSVKALEIFQMKTLASECPICFAASPGNGMLICIINRGIHLINDYEIQALEIKHAPNVDYALWNYIKHNKLLVSSVILALFLIILYSVDRNATSLKLKKNLDEITKQKEIIEANEKKLVIAKEAANAASKAKSTFLFNMSHDIRTPMNAILGYSDRMLRHIDDKAIVTDSAGKIKSSGEYLLSLINDVLDMAKIESNKVKLEESINDIREKAKVLCDVFEVNMQKKNLTFNIDFNDIKDTVIWYDSPKLRQIMLNLISNAVKYTPDGGTITHTMHQVQGNRNGYGRYKITVSDTGIGMTQDFIEHIFEQFSRSDDSITKETQGTGLGMAIVRKLIDLMNGTISIISELGKGTDITVELDLRIATEEEIRQFETKKKPSLPQNILKGLRILLVDDNELNREIAREILEDEGCTVVDIAENGVIAFNKVAESSPEDFNLILMDVQMPVMDGYEATRRIRALENKALADIPIIAMTANAFEDDRQNALEAGMNAHLTKPVDIKSLKETLSQFS